MSETGRHPKERRKARRVATELDVQLVGIGTPEIEVQVLNLSGGGFLALTPRYFAPITKFAISFVLPPFSLPEEELAPLRAAQAKAGSGGDGEEARDVIHAEGIVVRCEPVADGSTPELFSLAVAFLHLSPADHRRIEGYVQWRFERSLIESADH
jgi:hypothetical protein